MNLEELNDAQKAALTKMAAEIESDPAKKAEFEKIVNKLAVSNRPVVVVTENPDVPVETSDIAIRIGLIVGGAIAFYAAIRFIDWCFTSSSTPVEG